MEPFIVILLVLCLLLDCQSQSSVPVEIPTTVQSFTDMPASAPDPVDEEESADFPYSKTKIPLSRVDFASCK